MTAQSLSTRIKKLPELSPEIRAASQEYTQLTV